MSDDLVERVALREKVWTIIWEARNSTTDSGVLADAAISVVLEQAAKVADSYAHTHTYTRALFEDGNLTTHTGHSLVDPRKIAAAIRALVKEPT